MLKRLLVIVFVFATLFAKGQTNLVPNGSFEEYYSIPCNFSPTINQCKNWFSATGGGASPDYFSVFSNPDPLTCYTYIPQNAAGYQEARQGDFYAGIYLFNKNNTKSVEYIECKLMQPLLQKRYCVTFYVSLADSISKYSVNNVGIYFSKDSVFVDTTRRLAEYIPQILNTSSNPLTDKIGWTLVSGSFIAQGGEQFLIIGNFNSPENDDTVFVGGNGLSWNNGYSYIYIDSVSVKQCDGVGIEENIAEQIKIYPNPANEILNIDIGKLSQAEIEIYDISGRRLFQQKLSQSSQTLDVSALSPGVYVAAVYAEGRIVKREKVIITK